MGGVDHAQPQCRSDFDVRMVEKVGLWDPILINE
jgi:hypothetical protein